MTDEPFFSEQDGSFLPNPIARGPWDPRSLNGRVVAGLLGCELERRHGSADFIPARMTVDMYRLPGFDPIEVRTSVVREGRRIKVIDAEFVSGGVSMARATCQFLALAENAAGEVWKPAPWDAPLPDALAPFAAGPGMWEMRPIDGAMGVAGVRRTWLREVREMVGGVAVTPFQRVASACDFTSPWAHGGSAGLGYINSDVTLMLHRLPVGEWIGFENSYHGADGGVAVGECRLYDEAGPVGLASCVALAQAKSLSGPPERN